MFCNQDLMASTQLLQSDQVMAFKLQSGQSRNNFLTSETWMNYFVFPFLLFSFSEGCCSKWLILYSRGVMLLNL